MPSEWPELMKLDCDSNWEGVVKHSCFPLVLHGRDLEVITVIFNEESKVARIEVGDDEQQTLEMTDVSLTDESKWPLTTVARIGEKERQLAVTVHESGQCFKLSVDGVDCYDFIHLAGHFGADDTDRNLSGSTVKVNGRWLLSGIIPLPCTSKIAKYRVRSFCANQPVTSVELSSLQCQGVVISDLLEAICLHGCGEQTIKSLHFSRFGHAIDSLDGSAWSKLAQKCSKLEELTVTHMHELKPECRRQLAQFFCQVFALNPPLKKLHLAKFSERSDTVGVVEFL